MITKFKLFESIHHKPNVGDFTFSEKYGIGQITRYVGNGYYIKYDFNKDNDKINFIGLDNIKYWSENREELEAYITANKYNL